MSRPRIYADFQNADPQGRVRLNCVGTINDLARQQVQLLEGLKLQLYADDADQTGREDPLGVEGTVAYSTEEQCWVAIINWRDLRNDSQRDKDSQCDKGSTAPTDSVRPLVLGSLPSTPPAPSTPRRQ